MATYNTEFSITWDDRARGADDEIEVPALAFTNLDETRFDFAPSYCLGPRGA